MNKLKHYIELAEKALDGHISPINAYIEIHEAIKLLQDMKTSINDIAIEEAERLGKDYELKGYTVNTQTKTTYSFKHSPTYLQLEQELKNLQARMKFAANKGGEVIDENGEVVEPAETKHSTYIKLNKLP